MPRAAPPPPEARVFPTPGWLQDTYPDPHNTVTFKDIKSGEIFYQSNPGPQTWALNCWYSEATIGGQRGGGKSKALIARPAMGDPLLPPEDPAHASYLNDRSFRGVFLREEYQSMSEFVEEAIEFYRHFGGQPVGDPKHIKFKSGAKVYFNHLGEETTYEKYKGWNITWIGIEELTQIKTEKRYLKLKGSLRSTKRMRTVQIAPGEYAQRMFPGLRTQIMSTTNPDGPGATWVLNRFVEVPMKGGGFVPHNTPMRDPITNGVRIFIPFPIDANPYLHPSTPEGAEYHSNLMAQDEVTRKQWMDGDWHAGGGTFFGEYRPNGPIGEEKEKYPWACHVIAPVALQDWWFRWGSGDWGYDHPSAYHKFVKNEKDRRVHVCDELVMRRVGAFEQGTVLARWWMKDLQALKRAGGDPCITIYLSKDLFDRDDASKTRAQQMEAGIKEVLGPYGSVLLKYDDDERNIADRDPRRAQYMFQERRKQTIGQMCLALKPVYFERTDAWDYMRDMLRFRPTVLIFHNEEEKKRHLEEVFKRDGQLAYEMRVRELQQQRPEVLPMIQFWSHCRGIDRCLRVAQVDTSADNDPSRKSKREDVQKFNADERGMNGDDELESVRNGVIAYQDIKVDMPKFFFVNEAMEAMHVKYEAEMGEKLTDPTRLLMIARTQEANYAKVHNEVVKPFTPARASSQRHRPGSGYSGPGRAN